jgi:hypothetical protein
MGENGGPKQAYEVTYRFTGDPTEVRDIAHAMAEGLYAAQAEGRYTGAELVGGPTIMVRSE